MLLPFGSRFRLLGGRFFSAVNNAVVVDFSSLFLAFFLGFLGCSSLSLSLLFWNASKSLTSSDKKSIAEEFKLFVDLALVFLLFGVFFSASLSWLLYKLLRIYNWVTLAQFGYRHRMNIFRYNYLVLITNGFNIIEICLFFYQYLRINFEFRDCNVVYSMLVLGLFVMFG